LRCSAHPLAHALAVAVAEAGLGPLTSTSMNRSGEPPARDLAAARALVQTSEMGDPAEPVLVSDSGHEAGGEAPSSVVDCTGETPQVLRVGAIDCGRLEEVWSR
jgi:tRNA A37 threonylcarbamoyladenosine synthetase subunit TsaC/SUA5/YrdC